jgi:hypothetical protein
MSEAGAATFNNNVTAFSDERLKDNIETLEDGLDKVEQLRGVTYTRDDREEIGVIAQEVEKILPEIVLTADDEMGTKSVDYSRITAVLIEAVKELSAKVKELEIAVLFLWMLCTKKLVALQVQIAVLMIQILED